MSDAEREVPPLARRTADGPPRITLLTDFGTGDGYAAAMKGVLASLVPTAVLDDAAHDLPRGDVAAASWALRRFWRQFPRGTVHLVVVDPGVGTERKALAIEADGRFVVCPDNGAATSVLEEAETWRAVELAEVEPPGGTVSATFHGRDLFAPAAAALAQGTPLERLGPRVEAPVRLPPSRPEIGSDGGSRGSGGTDPRRVRRIQGRIVHVDRFGNLVTDVPGKWLEAGASVEVVGRTVPVRRTYGEVEPGELLALVNSDGRLEVAARDASAASILDCGRGSPVVVSLPRASGDPPG